MSLPPGFRVVGVSDDAPIAAIADDKQRFYGVQFHPEIVHTPQGAALLANFTRRVAGRRGDWTDRGLSAGLLVIGTPLSIGTLLS